MAAVGTPTIDVRSAVGAELSGAKVGEAVQGIGGMFGRLASEQADIVNRRKVAEAEIALAQSSNDLAVSLAETDDETQWTDITGKHIEGVQQTLWTTPNFRQHRAKIERPGLACGARGCRRGAAKQL